jgi:DNA ligase D-like protein (predicted ligase)
MIYRTDPPLPPPEAMPEHLSPMLARPGRLPQSEAGWAFEVKWDGVRAITYWRPQDVRIESRNLNDVSSRYPELWALGHQLDGREAVLDGEIVAFDEHGRPSFAHLQRRMHQTSASVISRLAEETPVTYMIFDVLYLDGRLTMALGYGERRELLERLDLNGASWQTPAYRQDESSAFLTVTAEHGLEGILAKRLDAPYRPGERSEEWLKIKHTNRQELVIGGWLEGKGRRTGQLGALLMGYYEGAGKERCLRYAGRVGTGFDDAELERLNAALATRQRRLSPFCARGIQPPRGARFAEPELVAEIEFSRWTRDRILRHSSYKGLRTDKAATEVERDSDQFAPAPSLTLPERSSGSAKGFYEQGSAGSRGEEAEQTDGGAEMPPRGVKEGSKRERQYEHIKEGERERGVSERRAEEIAARTVNKERARAGESRTRSRTSTNDISSGRRGGLRSGKPGLRGRTREQLYQEARALGIEGRSSMNKAQLQRAVDSRKRSASAPAASAKSSPSLAKRMDRDALRRNATLPTCTCTSTTAARSPPCAPTPGTRIGMEDGMSARTSASSSG